MVAQRSVEQVPGNEYTAGANPSGKNVKAEGTIFVPDKASYVRAVIVQVERRPLSNLAVGPFRDQVWRTLVETSECALLHLRLVTIRPEPSADPLVIRNAAAGGADALLAMLQLLGEKSGHQELKDAPLLLWGWSAAASFGTTFAQLYPERTVALVRYNAHLRGLSTDMKVLKDIPALLIAGDKDETAGTEDTERLWKSGRSAGAPWTFAIEPGATHGDERTFVSSEKLIIPWIAAVLRQRLQPDSVRLRTRRAICSGRQEPRRRPRIESSSYRQCCLSGPSADIGLHTFTSPTRP